MCVVRYARKNIGGKYCKLSQTAVRPMQINDQQGISKLKINAIEHNNVHLLHIFRLKNEQFSSRKHRKE